MADNEIDVSCILYKSIFDPNKLKINDITTYYDNGSKRKEKCVILTGEGGVEELFYVRDEYDHVCHTLEIVDQELFETWTKVLVHNARNKWISLNPTTHYPQTTAGFNNCFDDFVRNYITDEGAKEVIITYLNSSECVMKHNGTIEKHQSRIENMMNYADRLPGIGGILTDDAKKAIISHTFPKEWRSSFRKSMQTIQNTALPDIIQFMKQQQLDEKDGGRRVNEDDNRNQGKRKRNKNRNEREFRGGRARGRSGGRGRGREQHHGGRLKNECKIHGKHEWTNCRENPKGNYYDPNPGRGGRGREAGRGFQGRGNNGGRGGYHQPNHPQNHFQTNQNFHNGYYPNGSPMPQGMQPGGPQGPPGMPPQPQAHHYQNMPYGSNQSYFGQFGQHGWG